MALLLSFYLLLTGCQMTFYLNEDDGWGPSHRGVTALDKELIFRQEALRKKYKAGNLSSSQGLYETETVKLVIQNEGDTLYITFFGTDDVTEIYYNMIHWQEPYWTEVNSQSAVHAGFNRPLQEAMAPVIAEMTLFLADNPDPASRNIYILGHSAGGVHAVLCAYTLGQAFPSISDKEIYVQIGGSPAPGNSAFATIFNERISCHRYINGCDMMPCLLTPEMGYTHVGEAYRIGPDPDVFTASTGLWLTHHFVGDYAYSLR